MAVFGTDVLKPLSIVAQEIPEAPRFGIECEPEKREVPLGEFRGLRFVVRDQTGGHNERSRIVVCRIAFACIRHGED